MLTPDEALEVFLEWVDARGMELWPHQEDALMDLAVGDSVILGTPTGSGKSMVALGLCFMAVATGRTAYYTAPIKRSYRRSSSTWWTSSAARTWA